MMKIGVGGHQENAPGKHDGYKGKKSGKRIVKKTFHRFYAVNGL
jgi:hypothetical protein